MGLIIALTLGFATAAGAVGYLLTRRDLSRGQAALVAAGCTVGVGLGFLLVLYLAVVAFVVAAVAYRVLSSRVGTKQTLAVSATAFLGLLGACVTAFYFTLSTM